LRMCRQSQERHTATHCNTMQHNAVHCNTLQYTATHCNTLQHTATHYNTLPHTATHCNTPQHTATHRNTLQHAATRRCLRTGRQAQERHTQWSPSTRKQSVKLSSRASTGMGSNKRCNWAYRFSRFTVRRSFHNTHLFPQHTYFFTTYRYVDRKYVNRCLYISKVVDFGNVKSPINVCIKIWEKTLIGDFAFPKSFLKGIWLAVISCCVWNTLQWNTLQWNTLQCNPLQCNTLQWNTLQYTAIQWNTLQWNTLQWNTLQYTGTPPLFPPIQYML